MGAVVMPCAAAHSRLTAGHWCPTCTTTAGTILLASMPGEEGSSPIPGHRDLPMGAIRCACPRSASWALVALVPCGAPYRPVKEPGQGRAGGRWSRNPSPGSVRNIADHDQPDSRRLATRDHDPVQGPSAPPANTPREAPMAQQPAHWPDHYDDRDQDEDPPVGVSTRPLHLDQVSDPRESAPILPAAAPSASFGWSASSAPARWPARLPTRQGRGCAGPPPRSPPACWAGGYASASPQTPPHGGGAPAGSGAPPATWASSSGTAGRSCMMSRFRGAVRTAITC
jgi:hypothetical protein